MSEPKRSPEVEQLRERYGITCDCLGPPYYACPHYPVPFPLAEADQPHGGTR